MYIIMNRDRPKDNSWKSYNDTLVTAKTEEIFLKATKSNYSDSKHDRFHPNMVV